MQNIHVCFLSCLSKLKILHPVTLRSKSHYSYRWCERKKVASSFNWQFTDSMAGSDPDQRDAVQASGVEEEDLASLGVVLLEQATSQD